MRTGRFYGMTNIVDDAAGGLVLEGRGHARAVEAARRRADLEGVEVDAREAARLGDDAATSAAKAISMRSVAGKGAAKRATKPMKRSPGGASPMPEGAAC
jgi:hypothetical protein